MLCIKLGHVTGCACYFDVCIPVLLSQDGNFTLPESAAILRYLAATQEVPDHWYPRKLKHAPAGAAECLVSNYVSLHVRSEAAQHT